MTNNLIPTINISSIINQNFNSNKSIKTINKIKKACINIGFFQITNHGISKKSIKNICNVGNKFFNSPEKNKKNYLQKNGTIGNIKHCPKCDMNS
jgi:isopenicillin N synthase-like dioxygenase